MHGIKRDRAQTTTTRISECIALLTTIKQYDCEFRFEDWTRHVNLLELDTSRLVSGPVLTSNGWTFSSNKNMKQPMCL
jgi:hypothetical protein